MAKKVEKNSQNAKKSKFCVRTAFQPDFFLVKIGFGGPAGPFPGSSPVLPQYFPGTSRVLLAFFVQNLMKNLFFEAKSQKYKEK